MLFSHGVSVGEKVGGKPWGAMVVRSRRTNKSRRKFRNVTSTGLLSEAWTYRRLFSFNVFNSKNPATCTKNPSVICVSVGPLCLRAEMIEAFRSQMRDQWLMEGVALWEAVGAPRLSVRVGVCSRRGARCTRSSVRCSTESQGWGGAWLAWDKALLPARCHYKNCALQVKVLHACILFLNQSRGHDDKEVIFADLCAMIQ